VPVELAEVTLDERYVIGVGTSRERPPAVTQTDEVRICVWDLATARVAQRHVLRLQEVGRPLWVRDHQLATWVDGEQKLTIRTTDCLTGTRVKKPLLLDRFGPLPVFWCEASPDLKRLVGANHGACVMWDTQTGKVVRQFQGGPNAPDSMGFDGGWRMAAFGTATGLKMESVEEERPAIVFPQTEGAMSLSLSPDGRRVLAGNLGLFGVEPPRAIRLWGKGNLESGKGAFSPSGKVIVTGSVGDLMLRDGETGAELQSIQQEAAQELTVLRFVAGGHYVLSAGYDKRVHLWPLPADIRAKAR
jgi:WD40 repeat protein